MAGIPFLQPSETLPEGHICACYECATDRFPPESAEQPDLMETIPQGHFKVGWFPVIEHVLIDGEEYPPVVAECVTEGKQPWALVYNLPLHRCRTCGDHACMTIIHPKRIEVDVWENHRALWEEVWARVMARVAARKDA